MHRDTFKISVKQKGQSRFYLILKNFQGIKKKASLKKIMACNFIFPLFV